MVTKTKRTRISKKMRAAMETADVWNSKSGETETQIAKRINDRFEILDYLVNESIEGSLRSLIVAGPAGLGKSWSVETPLTKWDTSLTSWTQIKGYVKATGLFKLLYKFRNPGQVIVLDDADSVFFDETALNMLKAVCDTTETRRVSYLSEGILYDDDTEERLPKTFTFEGTIIFITNYDFDEMIDKGHKLAPHLSAMLSRSHYVDLAMKTKEDYIVRIKWMIKNGLLDSKGLSVSQIKAVTAFIDQHQDRLRELSLRVALKIADICKGGKSNWKKVAEVTCCRNG